MAFDKSAGVNADNAEVPVARDAWVKPEILSYEPVSAAKGPPSAGGIDGFSNLS